MTNTVFHTEDPKILQRQLAELELRLSTALARLEQRSAKQLRLIRVEGGVTHDAQLDTFVRVDPGTATTTVVLPQPTANMCNRGLAVLHVGTTGTVRVMAREGEVANASYVDVPDDALYTFLCDGSAWWAQKQNVVSITDGPGIDVTYDGAGNVTISNDGVLSVTGGDGCSNTGTAANPVIDVNVDGATILIDDDTLELGTVPLENLSTTGASNGDVITRTGGVTTWGPMDSLIGSYVHYAEWVIFENVNVSSPGDPIQGFGVAYNDRILLVGQSTASQNGLWVCGVNGSAPLTRPDDWTGTLDNSKRHSVVCKRWRDNVLWQENNPLNTSSSWDESLLVYCSNSTSTITVGTTSTWWAPASPICSLNHLEHDPVFLAVETNIDLSSPVSSIQGVTLEGGFLYDYRVALLGQTNGRENGIYHWMSTTAPLSRENDFPGSGLLYAGQTHSWKVTSGKHEGAEAWVRGDGTIGTTAFDWLIVGTKRLYDSYITSGESWVGWNLEESAWDRKKLFQFGPNGFYLFEADTGASDSYYMRQYYVATGGRYYACIIGGRSTTYAPSIRMFDNADSTYPNELHFYQSGMDLAWRFDADGNLVPGGGNSLGTSSAPAPIYCSKLVLPYVNRTINSSGAISAADACRIKLDTYGGAASDNLDDITDGEDGQVIVLATGDASHDVVIRDNAVGGGNIHLQSGSTYNFSATGYEIIMMYIGARTGWFELPFLP